MAITRTNLVFPNEHAPITACVLTNNVAPGDLIIAFVELGPGDTLTLNMTVSDTVNVGNYIRLGQQIASDNQQVNTFFYKVANKSGIPTINTSTLTGTSTGQICGVSFTGFTGTPTPDYNVGLQQASQAAGATSCSEFASAVTSFANSIGLVQEFVRGTFNIPVPSGWTWASNTFNAYKIAASANTTLAFAGNYNGTSTGAGAIFQLAAIYDFPGTGDDLISDGRDLINYDNLWNYVTPAATDWIHVGPTGAFCNLNASANPAMAYFAGSFTADQQAQCTLVSSVTNAFAGLAVRLTSQAGGPNGYVAWFDANNYNILAFNNGVKTNLIAGPIARASNPGDVFNLSVQGSLLTLSVNGVTLKQVSDSSINFGNPGIAFNGNHPSTVIDLFRAGSLGINVAGQSISSIVGQLGDVVGHGLTHQTGNFTAGTPTSALTKSLAGQTASFVEGGLVFAENLTGQTATFTEGVLTASTTQNITVTFGSQSFQFAQGQIFDGISYVLDTGANLTLTGQVATFAQGNILAEADYLPAPFTLTAVEGTATVSQAETLAALSITSSEGSISASVGSNTNLTLASQVIASSEGAVNLEADYFPTAQTLTSAEGTITFSTAGDFTVQLLGQSSSIIEGIIRPNVPAGTGPPSFIPPTLGKPVTTRTFSWAEMASRAWGSEFRAPDHRIYQFSGGNYKDSTDLGETGIYRRP